VGAVNFPAKKNYEIRNLFMLKNVVDGGGEERG